MGLTETQNSVRKSQGNFTSVCNCFKNSQKQQFLYDLLPKHFPNGALTFNETVCFFLEWPVGYLMMSRMCRDYLKSLRKKIKITCEEKK